MLDENTLFGMVIVYKLIFCFYFIIIFSYTGPCAEPLWVAGSFSILLYVSPILFTYLYYINKSSVSLQKKIYFLILQFTGKNVELGSILMA